MLLLLFVAVGAAPPAHALAGDDARAAAQAATAPPAAMQSPAQAQKVRSQQQYLWRAADGDREHQQQAAFTAAAYAIEAEHTPTRQVPAARRMLVDQRQKWERITEWISHDSAEAAAVNKQSSSSSRGDDANSARATAGSSTSQAAAVGDAAAAGSGALQQSVLSPGAIESVAELRYSLDTMLVDPEQHAMMAQTAAAAAAAARAAVAPTAAAAGTTSGDMATQVCKSSVVLHVLVYETVDMPANHQHTASITTVVLSCTNADALNANLLLPGAHAAQAAAARAAAASASRRCAADSAGCQCGDGLRHSSWIV